MKTECGERSSAVTVLPAIGAKGPYMGVRPHVITQPHPTPQWLQILSEPSWQDVEQKLSIRTEWCPHHKPAESWTNNCCFNSLTFALFSYSAIDNYDWWWRHWDHHNRPPSPWFILEGFIWKAEIKSVLIGRQLDDLLIMKLHHYWVNLNCDKSSAGPWIIYDANAGSIYIHTLL